MKKVQSMNLRKILTCLICCGWVSTGLTQSTNPSFLSAFDLDNKENYVNSVQQHGNKYYAVGTNLTSFARQEAFLISLDRNGLLVFKKNFKIDSLNSSRTNATEVVVLNANEIIISGQISYQNPIDTSSNTIYPWIIKMDSLGQIVWQKVLIDSTQELNLYSGPSLIQDGRDLVLIWNSTNLNTGKYRLVVSKFDSDGLLKTTKIYQPFGGQQVEFQIFGVSKLLGGGFLLSGRTSNYSVVNSDSRAMVYLDSNLNLLWAREIGEKLRYQFYSGIVQQKNNVVTAIGNYSATDVFFQYSGFIEEIDLTDGASNRYHRLPFTDPVIVRNIFKSSDGKLIIGGSIEDGFLQNANTWVLDSNWKWLWQTSYSKPSNGSGILTSEKVGKFINTGDGGYLLAGNVSDNSWPANGNEDCLFIKVDSNGCLVAGCNVVGINTDLAWQSEIRIYPNPAAELLHIENAQQQTLLRIYSMQGSLLLAKELLAEKDVIQLEDYSPGVYILEFENKQGIRQQERLVLSR